MALLGTNQKLAAACRDQEKVSIYLCFLNVNMTSKLNICRFYRNSVFLA
jgi:hypothetical protein